MSYQDTHATAHLTNGPPICLNYKIWFIAPKNSHEFLKLDSELIKTDVQLKENPRSFWVYKEHIMLSGTVIRAGCDKDRCTLDLKVWQ